MTVYAGEVEVFVDGYGLRDKRALVAADTFDELHRAAMRVWKVARDELLTTPAGVRYYLVSEHRRTQLLRHGALVWSRRTIERHLAACRESRVYAAWWDAQRVKTEEAARVARCPPLKPFEPVLGELCRGCRGTGRDIQSGTPEGMNPACAWCFGKGVE